MNTTIRMFIMMAVMITIPYWRVNMLGKVTVLLVMLLIALALHFNPDSAED